LAGQVFNNGSVSWLSSTTCALVSCPPTIKTVLSGHTAIQAAGECYVIGGYPPTPAGKNAPQNKAPPDIDGSASFNSLPGALSSARAYLDSTLESSVMFFGGGWNGTGPSNVLDYTVS